MTLEFPAVPGITLSGVGITLVTSFIRWRLPKIPHYISSPGIITGVGLFLVPLIQNLRLGTVVAGILALICIAFAVEWQLASPRTRNTEAVETETPTPQTSSSTEFGKTARSKNVGEGEIDPPGLQGGETHLDRITDNQPRAPKSTRSTPQISPREKKTTDEEVVMKLSGYILAGQKIQTQFIQSNNAENIQTSQEQWSKEVESYLRENVGFGRATQFATTDANPWDGQPNGRNMVGGYYWAKIVARNRVLTEIMVELERRSSQNQ